MNINLGDIYWIKQNEGISHPHVIINIHGNDITICALTTNQSKANMPGNVVLEPGEGNLIKQSIVEVSKIAIIFEDQLDKYVGSLNLDRVKEISNGIGFINRSFLNSKK